jgi:hypothetical protein
VAAAAKKAKDAEKAKANKEKHEKIQKWVDSMTMNYVVGMMKTYGFKMAPKPRTKRHTSNRLKAQHQLQIDYNSDCFKAMESKNLTSICGKKRCKRLAKSFFNIQLR